MKSSTQHVESYLTQLRETVAQLSPELIDRVVTILLNSARCNSKVFVFGNGGSAATASHFACDLAKNTIVPDGPRFRAISLNDNVPLLSAWANDTGYDNIFAGQLASLAEPGDVVIGISCSGNSHNVLNAMRVARQQGAITIAFTGDTGGQLTDMVDLSIRVPSSRIEQQEDVHLILEHCICATIRIELAQECSPIPHTIRLTSSQRVVAG